MIGIEAGDLAGEAFESGLSKVTGYEYNAFSEDLIETVKIDPPAPDAPPTPDPVDPDKTGPVPPPAPDAPTPEPDADTTPVDPDGPTTPEPGPDATPVDSDASTSSEPDLTTDVKTDATAAPNLDEAADLPVSDADPPLNPLDPAKEPLNDPYADTEPPLAEDAPLSPVNEANLARGPPESSRDLKPIDKTKLDGNIDNSEGYEFRKPLYDPARIPEGGAFGGDVSFATNAGTTRQIPGQSVTAPDGTLLELGPLVGTSATATVFASKTDPSKVIRLVEFTDPTAGALDAVGRKVGEAIQNPSGNGNFRLTVVKEQFTAIDPATGNKWLLMVEENLAVTGQGITNAKKRFAKRPPNAAERAQSLDPTSKWCQAPDQPFRLRGTLD